MLQNQPTIQLECDTVKLLDIELKPLFFKSLHSAFPAALLSLSPPDNPHPRPTHLNPQWFLQLIAVSTGARDMPSHSLPTCFNAVVLSITPSSEGSRALFLSSPHSAPPLPTCGTLAKLPFSRQILFRRTL